MIHYFHNHKYSAAPSVPWIIASVMEKAAIRGCHLKGIMFIPRLFISAIDAVKRKELNVNMPRYIISGLPKIRKYVMNSSIIINSFRVFKNLFFPISFLNDKLKYYL